ncbi:MAG TPA: amidohydrolase family protein [Actinomycetota bacterium]|nr:amidohydrolase family protein [Actinomycetota bacterium]
MKAIKARLVWHEGSFQPDAAVLVEGDRIAGVLPAAEVRTPDVEDWDDVALIPGTVNAHGHAFQSLLKGIADDRTFDSWRDDVLYPLSERLTHDDIYAGALFAFAEALLAGTTTTVDFFYLHDSGNANAERVIRAAREIGIRLVLARAFYDEDAPTGAPARYREPTPDAVDRTRALYAGHSDDPLISVQPAPHSLHAAAPETVRAALALAHELDVPCHLHLAEARYERDQIQERHGTTPVRLLSQEGLLNERLIAIHAVWMDEEELDLLAEAKVSVVHCPGANAFLGDGIMSLPEMLQRGMRVALGPDGGCANNRQSVFDEMRHASLFAKARLQSGDALDAATIFRLGTVNGGEVLGSRTGEIASGYFADLVAIDLTDLSVQPTGWLDKHLVNSMQPTAIAKVMVGGEVVVDGGRLTRFDPADIRARVESVTSRWR